MKFLDKNKGITLIALVITIIVLLILAGVTITVLTGNDGILSQAAKAKQENEKASIIEEIRLDIATKQTDNLGSINEDEFYEILGRYGTISADEITLTTTKGNYDILISDIYSGEVASSLVTTPLSSWEYTLDDENKTITLTKYIGADAKIFIPGSFGINDTMYNAILSRVYTDSERNDNGPFCHNTIIAEVKFDDSIQIVSNNGYGLFKGCSNLEKVYNIPNQCTRLDYAFTECTKLNYFAEIPESVTNLSYTFANTNLKNAPTIPINVNLMERTFFQCSQLEGTIIIKSNNVTNADRCFTNTNKTIFIKVNENTTTYNTFNTLISSWLNVFFSTDSQSNIVCWGDSLTVGAGGNGTSFPFVLKSLTGSIYEITNLGVGGENTSTIAGRQGGIPFIVDKFTIPSDTSAVEISISGKDGSTVRPALQGTNGLNPCSIDGIEGNITYENSKYYFTRRVSGNSVEVAKGTEIITSGMDNYRDADILIIWTGQNDGANTSNISDIIEKQKKMIEYSGIDNYIIIGLLYAGDEVNNVMAEAYGEHFLDVRNALSTDDSDTVSEDYKSDSIHLNADGYTIVGTEVYNKMNLLGYIT